MSDNADNTRKPLTEAQIRDVTVGEPTPLSGSVVLVPYDPRWPEFFAAAAGRIRAALGPRTVQIEHTGSTSVPGLLAKPIIDIVLVVADSSAEEAYAPALEPAGFVLRIREPQWYEHRMFKGRNPEVNLHVFSAGCAEMDRMLLFRDHLRANGADRDLYARTKARLAQQEWKYMQNYADAKIAVIDEIIARSRLLAHHQERK